MAWASSNEPQPTRTDLLGDAASTVRRKEKKRSDLPLYISPSFFNSYVGGGVDDSLTLSLDHCAHSLAAVHRLAGRFQVGRPRCAADSVAPLRPHAHIHTLTHAHTRAHIHTCTPTLPPNAPEESRNSYGWAGSNSAPPPHTCAPFHNSPFSRNTIRPPT